jgi:hypothetical protein
MVKPFIEHKISESVVIRAFSANTADEELQWHWDEEDRLVTPLEETDWQFQFDNELPFTIKGVINIPAGVIHRVIKGTGELKVKITKQYEVHTTI